MEDMGREASAIARYIEGDWERLGPIGNEQGVTALAAAMSSVHAVSSLASRATDAEFKQIMLRAFAIVAIRKTTT